MTKNKRSTTVMTWIVSILVISSTGFNGYLFVELNNKKAEVKSVQQDLNDTKKDVKNLSNELDKISELNESLEADKEEQVKKIDELNKSVEQKNAENKEKDSIIEQKDSEISNLQAMKQQKKQKKQEELVVSEKPSKEPVAVKTSVEVVGERSLTVEATKYSALDGAQSGITATGIDVRSTSTYEGMIIVAVDPNVIPLWSIIDIEGYGRAIALDTGGAIKGNKIDILTSDVQDAMNFGRQSINITIVREGK